MTNRDKLRQVATNGDESRQIATGGFRDVVTLHRDSLRILRERAAPQHRIACTLCLRLAPSLHRDSERERAQEVTEKSKK